MISTALKARLPPLELAPFPFACSKNEMSLRIRFPEPSCPALSPMPEPLPFWFLRLNAPALTARLPSAPMATEVLPVPAATTAPDETVTSPPKRICKIPPSPLPSEPTSKTNYPLEPRVTAAVENCSNSIIVYGMLGRIACSIELSCLTNILPVILE